MFAFLFVLTCLFLSFGFLPPPFPLLHVMTPVPPQRDTESSEGSQNQEKGGV